MAADGPPPPPDVMDLADRYGLQLGQPAWLPDLISATTSRRHPAPETRLCA